MKKCRLAERKFFFFLSLSKHKERKTKKKKFSVVVLLYSYRKSATDIVDQRLHNILRGTKLQIQNIK